MHTLHTAVSPDDLWVFQHYPEAAVVAVSRSQIASVPEPRRPSIRVIYNSCDFAAYDLADPPGEYLAFLGRMGARKNPLDAIRIAKAAGLPIVLAGRPQYAEEEQYFAEKIQPLIDGKMVRYIGPANHEKKRKFLRDAAAFLFPTSWSEPCAVAPLEAMACGLPVLAYDNGSVPEVIDYGVTGFYADSADALAALVPKALALDRRAVREHARRRFSHQRMVDEYLATYREVTARRT